MECRSIWIEEDISKLVDLLLSIRSDVVLRIRIACGLRRNRFQPNQTLYWWRGGIHGARGYNDIEYYVRRSLSNGSFSGLVRFAFEKSNRKTPRRSNHCQHRRKFLLGSASHKLNLERNSRPWRISDLQRRLQTLPSKMEHEYKQMLLSIPEIDADKTGQFFNWVRYAARSLKREDLWMAILLGVNTKSTCKVSFISTSTSYSASPKVCAHTPKPHQNWPKVTLFICNFLHYYTIINYKI